MNELKVFNNEEFGTVRTVVLADGPWFVGKDVAEILGYSNTNKAVLVHVDEEDKFLRDSRGTEMGKLFISIKEMYDKLGRQNSWFINESGLYSLVLKSKLPTAKKFQRWVTSEVLPSIRKTGGYSTVEITPTVTIKNGKVVTSMVNLCQSLGLDVREMWRRLQYIKKWTPKFYNENVFVYGLDTFLTRNGVDCCIEELTDKQIKQIQKYFDEFQRVEMELKALVPKEIEYDYYELPPLPVRNDGRTTMRKAHLQMLSMVYLIGQIHNYNDDQLKWALRAFMDAFNMEGFDTKLPPRLNRKYEELEKAKEEQVEVKLTFPIRRSVVIGNNRKGDDV